MKTLSKDKNIYIGACAVLIDKETISAGSIRPQSVCRDGSRGGPTIFVVYAVGRIIVGMEDPNENHTAQ